MRSTAENNYAANDSGSGSFGEKSVVAEKSRFALRGKRTATVVPTETAAKKLWISSGWRVPLASCTRGGVRELRGLVCFACF